MALGASENAMPFPGVYPPPILCKSSPETVVLEAQMALDAFQRSELPSFYAAQARSERALGCLDAPLAPADVGVVYLAQAVQSYLTRDDQSARELLRGAASLGRTLPEGITSRYSPLKTLDQEARLPIEPTLAPLVPPLGGQVWVDGVPATARPTDRPYLVQVIWEGGRVRWSGILPPDQAPELTLLAPPPAPPAPVQLPCPEQVCPAPSRAPGPGLLIAAMGTTTLASGLWALSATQHAQYYAPDNDEATRTTIKRRANLAAAGAVGVGAVAVGLDITLIVRSLRQRDDE